MLLIGVTGKKKKKSPRFQLGRKPILIILLCTPSDRRGNSRGLFQGTFPAVDGKDCRNP
jgi:hypothetical protein